jgi:hypothetical protein
MTTTDRDDRGLREWLRAHSFEGQPNQAVITLGVVVGIVALFGSMYLSAVSHDMAMFSWVAGAEFFLIILYAFKGPNHLN